jgi:hypothetical protein
MAGLFDPRFNKPALGLLGLGAGTSLFQQTAVTKRKAFFSFHFDDVMRVNNVRHSWKIDHPDSALMRSFYDSSLWESRKLDGDDALKRLIREGVQYTSAVCVLIGTQTWSRRWVRYEIARSVIDGRGLLGVHINGLNHHQRRMPDPLGFNPMEMLGIFHATNGQFFLYEQQHVLVNALTNERIWQWRPYADHTAAVALPKYMPAPTPGHVLRLSHAVPIYNFALSEGHKNIGAWIDTAARAVGR